MKRAFVVAVAMCTVLLGNVAAACPSCYGDPESPMTQGMNMAIMSLLGITGGVLIAIVSFFVYVRRRTLQLRKTFEHRLN